MQQSDRSRPHPRPQAGSPFVEGPDGVRHPGPVEAQALLGLIVAGRQLEERLDAELRAEQNLGIRAYEALLHLAAFAPDGYLRMAKLAEQAPLSQSRVSRLVAELERAGWVTRTTDEGDSRGVRVRITDDGLAKLRAAQQTHHRGLEEHFFSRLSRRELTELARMTGRILEDRSADRDGRRR